MKKSFKIIEKIFTPNIRPEGAGASVRRIIGTHHLHRIDPFIMLDLFSIKLPGGFPDHPHRGFQAITHILEGEVLHEDLKGNRGRLGPGDLQLMTVGKGIMHAEMPTSWEKESTGIQLWVNLPAKDKFCDYKYQVIPKEDVFSVTHEGVTVKIIGGEAFGKQGPLKTNPPSLYLDVSMAPNSTYEQLIPKGWNSVSFLYKGKALFGENKQEAEANNCVLLKKDDNELLTVKTQGEEARLILFAGQPLNEPVVSSGPFIMSDKEQVERTFDDFKNGKNGFEGAPGWASEITKMANSKN